MIIEVLFPEAANLYGCLFDIECLRQTLKDDAKIIFTHLKDEPYFVKNRVDLVYIGPTRERFQSKFVKALKPYQERIKELIEDDVIFIALGNSFEIFGQRIDEEDGLNIFDYTARRDFSHHHLSRFLGRFKEIKLIGFKSKFSSVQNIKEPFIEVIKGDPKEGSSEGIRHRNFFGTYLIGPLFILNPPFLQYLLHILGYAGPIAYYEDAMEAYRNRLTDFEKCDELFR